MVDKVLTFSPFLKSSGQNFNINEALRSVGQVLLGLLIEPSSTNNVT